MSSRGLYRLDEARIWLALAAILTILDRDLEYLRGSVFCGECDGRLIYTRATGRSGATYEYFVCSGRQEGTCSQPHHRVEAVERAIEDEYAQVELTALRREQTRDDVRAYVAAIDGQAEPERERIEATLKSIAAQEKKLLQAHYDDLITAELFAEEQQRLRRERIAAEQRRGELQADHHVTLERLELALSLTDRVQAAYLNAEPMSRRVFNQAISPGSGSIGKP